MPGGTCGLFSSLEKQRRERDQVNRTENGCIRENVGAAELLAQLAEEAAELAQAALKYRRALTEDNPTPASVEEALRSLQETIADVDLCIVLADIPEFDELRMMEEKRKRWVQRLMELGGDN